MVEQDTLDKLQAIADLPMSDYATKYRELKSIWRHVFDRPSQFQLETDVPSVADPLTGSAAQAATAFLKVLVEHPALAHFSQSVIRRVIVHCTSAQHDPPIALEGDELHFYKSDVNWTEYSAARRASFLLGKRLYDQLDKHSVGEYRVHAGSDVNSRSDFADLFSAVARHDSRQLDTLAKQYGSATLQRKIEIIQRVLTPDIDFNRFDWRTFESLVADLLLSLGFSEVTREWNDERLKGHVDIKASWTMVDPFGAPLNEIWIVEVKLYRNERADVNALRQLAGYLTALPETYRGLLVTSSHLTSAARSWLDSYQNSARVHIRIIDGTELRDLILNSPELLRNYFSKKPEA